ncbi:hypothetical protein ACFLYL_03545 [Chloroflexota bacterium]
MAGQFTLVAYYRSKPQLLKNILQYCIQKIDEKLSGLFFPYEIDQIHATIVGLECSSTSKGFQNTNFKRNMDQARYIDFLALITYLKGTSIFPIDIQIGGYKPSESVLTVQKQSLYVRSFSVNNDGNIVMLGWAMKNQVDQNTIDELRRKMQDFGILHKYYYNPEDVDNNLYFVLGKIPQDFIRNNQNYQEDISLLENDIRNYLSENPIIIPINQEYLSIIFYYRTQFPLNTTISIPIMDIP